MIVPLDSARGGAGHSLVLVWLDGGWTEGAGPAYPWHTAVHVRPPAGLVGQLRGAEARPGAFVAVDVAAAAAGSGGRESTWEDAVGRGTEMLDRGHDGRGRVEVERGDRCGCGVAPRRRLATRVLAHR